MRRILPAIILLSSPVFAQTIGPQTFASVGGDCTFSTTNITCTKTGGVALTTLATSGYANIATPFNTAAGFQAFNAVPSGTNNTAFGYQAGKILSSGSNNTFVGQSAGIAVTNGTTNTVVGAASFITANASGNTVVGYNSLQFGAGTNDTAIGNQVLGQTTSGQDRTAIGYGAGFFQGRVQGGHTSTNAVSTASFGTYIGFQTSPSSTTQRDYQTIIGAGAIAYDAGASVTLGLIGTDTVYTGPAVIGMATVTTYYIASGLPSCTAALTAARAFITDAAAAPVFSSAVTGGGTLGIPVYCDGTAWRNG
jgi:hypothetical protein